MEVAKEKEFVRREEEEEEDVIEAKVGRSPFRDLEGGETTVGDGQLVPAVTG